MMCRNCGHENDSDAAFCEKCGTNLNESLGISSANLDHASKEGISTLSKVLIVIVIVLVGALGVFGGMYLMGNQTKPLANNTTASTDTPTTENSQTTDTTTPAYKTYSNGIISFQYPFSWSVLENNANTMVIVGYSNYPAFSVYNESKYGHTSLNDYVTQSKSGMKKNGYNILSEQSLKVDGLPAYQVVYQGKNGTGVLIIQDMVLVERSPGSQYFALVGVDKSENYDQVKGTFTYIINSFKFLK